MRIPKDAPLKTDDVVKASSFISSRFSGRGIRGWKSCKAFLLETMRHDSSPVWRRAAFMRLQACYIGLHYDDDALLREYLEWGEVWAAEEATEYPFQFMATVASLLSEGASELLADLHGRACRRITSQYSDATGALYDCHGSFLSSCRNAGDWLGVARCLSAILDLGPVPPWVKERLAPELASVPAGTVPPDLLAAFDLSDGERP